VEVTARHGSVADIGTVASLALGGRQSLASARGGEEWLHREALPEPLDQSYSALVTGLDSTVIVGTIDHVEVGLLALRETSGAGGSVGDIVELYVIEGARGVGVGEAMMDLAIDWVRDRGMSGLGGRSLPGDRATKNLFETYGLVARSIEVYKALP
jgi:GNAT superfamily N-acetyltransferase